MSKINKNLSVLILAGGKGKRLWPLAKEVAPKQFLKIVGKETLLDHTIKRNLKLVQPRNVYIVSIKKYSNKIIPSLKKFKIPKKNLILEPIGKNTAPAVLLASTIIHRKNNDSVILFSPCDQIVTKHKEMISDVKVATRAAELGFIVLFGVKPSSAETEYGYIKFKKGVKGLSSNDRCFTIEEFVEKPAKSIAVKLLNSKKYLWHTGLSLFKSKTVLNEFKINAPSMYKEMINIKEDLVGLAGVYQKIKKIAFEKIIVQQSKKLVLIKAGFVWQDLGQWDLIYNMLPKDKNKNAIKGNVTHLDTSNSFISGQKKRIVTLGLKDIIIVDTDRGLLVAHKNYISKLKEAVESFSLKGKSKQ